MVHAAAAASSSAISVCILWRFVHSTRVLFLLPGQKTRLARRRRHQAHRYAPIDTPPTSKFTAPTQKGLSSRQ